MYGRRYQEKPRSFGQAFLGGLGDFSNRMAQLIPQQQMMRYQDQMNRYNQEQNQAQQERAFSEQLRQFNERMGFNRQQFSADNAYRDKMFDYRQGRDATADTRWQTEHDYTRGRDKTADEFERQRLANRDRLLDLRANPPMTDLALLSGWTSYINALPQYGARIPSFSEFAMNARQAMQQPQGPQMPQGGVTREDAIAELRRRGEL